MRNILAIAQKELRSYFASPIAYIVLGFWALLYGWFFITILAYFVRASMQAGRWSAGGERQPAADSAAGAKRHHPGLVPAADGDDADVFGRKTLGTIELLLTSPITDWQSPSSSSAEQSRSTTRCCWSR